MALLFRALPVAAAVAPVLGVLAAAAAVVAAADSVLPVVRMRPIDISGTYTTTYASTTGGGCPSNFTIGKGEPFSKADGLAPRAPHPDLARNFLGAALSEAGVPCTGGALVAVSSLQTFNPEVMKGVGKPNGTALFHSSAFSQRMLHWADVVGLGVATVSCGASAAAAAPPRWGPDTWVAIGEMDWFVQITPPEGGPALRYDFGGRNRTAVFLNSRTVWCVMTAPPRRELVQRVPVEERDDDGEDGAAAGTSARTGDEGRKVSAGAAVGIGVAAAAAGLALGAAGGLSTARWHRRRLHSSTLASRQATAASAVVGKGGSTAGLAATWASQPPLSRAGGAPQSPHHTAVGLVLPTIGEPGGVPPAAAATAAAAADKELREAFGLVDAPPMPPELADSMAPPAMPDVLRGSTISDPSLEARSGRS